MAGVLAPIRRLLRGASLRVHRRFGEREPNAGKWFALQRRLWRGARRIGHRLFRRQPPVLLVLDGRPRLCGFAAITGWAVARHGPVKWVEAIVHGRVVAAGPPAEWRPDAVERFPSFHFHGPPGFRLAPPVGVLTDGTHELLLRAHDGRGRTAELHAVLDVHDYRVPDAGELPAHLRGSDREYQHWIRRFEKSSTASAELSALQPLEELRFTVVMPIYRPDPRHLREAIDSVRAQTEPRWELRLCDDGSGQADLTAYLNRLIEADSRIRLITHDDNRGISEATNAGVRAGVGDHVALLDQDDRLAPVALEAVMACLKDSPCDWLYSDEDRIDPLGCRVEPFFKPDWSPDLLLSMMYAAHLSVYRRTLLDRIGLCRREFDGAQDWELALRAASATERIGHVPKVLYHWRQGGRSAGAGFNRVCHERGRRAIREFVQRHREQADVADGPNGCTFHVRYRHERPMVSILIPTRDNAILLKRCLRSIRARTDYPSFEIIVLDNGSRDARALRLLRSWARPPWRRVLRLDMPFNHSRLNNLAAKEARGELLLLLNDDVEVINPGWLTALVEQAWRPAVGAAGAWLLHPDQRSQHAGIVLGLGPVATPLHSGVTRDGLDRGMIRLLRNVAAVSGACLMIRKSLYLEMDGLDEEDLPTSFNDVDLCLRLRQAGYRIVYSPLARLYHHESASRSFEDEELFIRIMLNRWGEEGLRDPFWNPNLPHGERPHTGFAFHWGRAAPRSSHAGLPRTTT